MNEKLKTAMEVVLGGLLLLVSASPLIIRIVELIKAI